MYDELADEPMAAGCLHRLGGRPPRRAVTDRSTALGSRRRHTGRLPRSAWRSATSTSSSAPSSPGCSAGPTRRREMQGELRLDVVIGGLLMGHRSRSRVGAAEAKGDEWVRGGKSIQWSGRATRGRRREGETTTSRGSGHKGEVDGPGGTCRARQLDRSARSDALQRGGLARAQSTSRVAPRPGAPEVAPPISDRSASRSAERRVSVGRRPAATGRRGLDFAPMRSIVSMSGAKRLCSG